MSASFGGWAGEVGMPSRWGLDDVLALFVSRILDRLRPAMTLGGWLREPGVPGVADNTWCRVFVSPLAG